MSALAPIFIIFLCIMFAKDDNGDITFRYFFLWLVTFAIGYFILVILLGSFWT